MPQQLRLVDCWKLNLDQNEKDHEKTHHSEYICASLPELVSEGHRRATFCARQLLQHIRECLQVQWLREV